MSIAPNILMFAVSFLFLAGILSADVGRVSSVAQALVDIIKDVTPVILMTCIVLSALLYGVYNLNVGDQIRKQFVMVMYGLLTTAIIVAVIGVAVPPVVGTIYGAPENSCLYGCSTSCNTYTKLCCPATSPYFCGGTATACIPVPCP